MLKEEDRGVIAAALMLRDYCDQAKACIGCVFDITDDEDEGICPFATTPRDWKFLERAAQGIAKSSVQQTEGRLFPAEQNKNSGLPEFDQNPPGGGLRPS